MDRDGCEARAGRSRKSQVDALLKDSAKNNYST